jgi:hypothetical protein
MRVEAAGSALCVRFERACWNRWKIPSAPKVLPMFDGGGGGIRTPETLSGLTVFKTAGFNRSPTPPLLILA